MYNKVGILGAMQVEILHLLTHLENKQEKQIGMITFYEGELSGKQVVIAKCGVGKVNAATATQMLISCFNVDCVINTGVAGAISEQLDVCDVVISTDLVQHDFDTSGAGDKKGVVCGFDVESFEAEKSLIEVCKTACEEVLEDSKYYLGRIATGDQFISDKKIKDDIKDYFEPYCVEMEGCAIAQTCYVNNVPFVVLRSISDKANDVAGMTFDEFVTVSANLSAKIIIKVVQKV